MEPLTNSGTYEYEEAMRRAETQPAPDGLKSLRWVKVKESAWPGPEDWELRHD